MIDLRAPVEFARGAFPASVSLPLMTDNERELVGTCYKQQGQQAAIELGHQLVQGTTKHLRVEAWIKQLQERPDTVIYCFRGGLRSRISQQWLAAAGYPVALVEGGYKALRQYCLNRTETLVRDLPALVLSGRTGTGKTTVLAGFPRYVDLEHLAHHRGSSFGKQFDPQPSQIDFESALTQRLLGLAQAGNQAVAFEDESRLIGRCMLPECLQAKLKQSPILVLEDDLEARVERILAEYVVAAMAERIARLPDYQQAFEHLAQGLQDSLYKIRKRLGGEAYKQAQNLLTEALDKQSRTDNYDAHKDWIRFLLNRYYDPMYDYQLALKSDRVVIRGTSAQLQAWLTDYAQVT
jgi:tRNA 2-selenouridine synthase